MSLFMLAYIKIMNSKGFKIQSLCRWQTQYYQVIQLIYGVKKGKGVVIVDILAISIIFAELLISIVQ